MSTSDNLPPDTGSDNTSADEQRLDRLYNRMTQSGSESSSPTDLDDLIRAAATTPLQPAVSSYWQWQQRAGWATAAAVVLTSALFLALPESTPKLANSAQSSHSHSTAMTAPAALDTDIQESVAQGDAIEIAADMAIEMPVEINKPHADQLTNLSSQRRTDNAKATAHSKGAEEAVEAVEMEAMAPIEERAQMADLAEATPSAARLDLAPPSTAPAWATRQARSKTARSNKRRKPSCNTIAEGLIERICDVPGSNNSYILKPSTTTQCEALRLDEQAARPAASAESNADEFVYTVGNRKFSATCNNGEWLVQSFARGR